MLLRTIQGYTYLQFVRIRFIFAAIWAVGGVSAGALLTSLHVPITAPVPGAVRLSTAPETAEWAMIHLLSGDCDCSANVAQYLVRRGVTAGVYEDVVVFGRLKSAVAEELKTRGYRLAELQADQSRSYGVTGVPALLLLSRGRKIRYAGGYGTGYRDLHLLSEVRKGTRPSPYPVLGCALRRETMRSIDPLGLKWQ